MLTAESMPPGLFFRLVDSLYIEALVLADEARSCFDRLAAEDRGDGDMMARLSFTCESLKVTTRLMHVIAWLMTQKARQRGEIAEDTLSDPKHRLGPAAPTDDKAIAAMPDAARQLVEGSQSLYDRVRRLEYRTLAVPSGSVSEEVVSIPIISPARELIGRLEKVF